MKVSIVGFGKLGSALAAAFVSRDFEVAAFDVSEEALRAPFNSTYPEPQVYDLLTAAENRNALRLGVITPGEPIPIQDTCATFVIVPTLSLPDGSFDNQYCVEAMKIVGQSIKDKGDYHLVVLCSTVMPGACEGEIIPALEEATGSEIGDKLGFCYNPAFIAQGSVVHDFLNPDFVLIGSQGIYAFLTLQDIYCGLLDAPLRIIEDSFALMSIPSAEITKLAINTYITTKISFANMLAALCHRTPGANIDDVTGAMGLDRRISPRYLKGATGYGGPCFPRDGRAMMEALNRSDLWNGYAGIPYTGTKINQVHVEFVGNLALDELDDGYGTILILGEAYKTGTPIVEESFSLSLANYLNRADIDIVALDPMIDSWSDFDSHSDLAATIGNADVIIIALPYEQFKHLPYRKGQTIIDCWRIFGPEDIPAGVKYVPLGIGQ